MPVTGALLAGGRSARFGTNKALALFQGKPFYQVALDLLEPRCEKVLISANHDEAFSGSAYQIVHDENLGKGPLGGMVTLIKRSHFPWVLVLACDMPSIGEECIDFLLGLIHQKKKVICFKQNSCLQPFPGLYHQDLLEDLSKWLANENYRVHGFIDTLPEDEKQIISLSPTASSPQKEFANINTREDYNQLMGS